MQIPLEQIDPPKFLLREVDTNSADFLQLLDAIRDHGLLNSVIVRPSEGDRFELVDGNHRLTACRMLNTGTIEAIVRTMSDVQVWVTQIQANSVRFETSRMEYARHLLRLQQAQPEMTLSQLAKLVGQRNYWVRQQLNLLDLRPEYQTMADRGHLPVMNAYVLAKLPPHIQGRFLELALKLDPKEFRLLVGAEITRLQMNAKDRSEEKRLASIKSDPAPMLRPLSELVKELRSQTAARGLVAHAKPQNLVDAFRLGVQWTLNVDPLTLEERKAKIAEKQISKIFDHNRKDN